MLPVSKNLTVKDLKSQLRKLGLPTTGNKEVLIKRLKEHVSNETQPIANSTRYVDENQSAEEEQDTDASSEGEYDQDFTIQPNAACQNKIDKRVNESQKDGNTEKEMNAMIELELLRKERDVLKLEKRILELEKREKTTQRFSVSEISAMLPVFNPKEIESLSAEKWITKLETLQKAYRWNEQILLVAACSKLKGAAKIWCDSSLTAATSWKVFAKEICKTFPARFNSADIHTELSKRKRLENEDFTEYIYSMKAIAEKGEIPEDAVVKYIIGGLRDTEMIQGVMSSKARTVDEVIDQIRWIASVRPSTGQVSKANKQDPKLVAGNPILDESFSGKRCYKCNMRGHIRRDCKEKIEKGNFNIHTRQHRVNFIAPKESEYIKDANVQVKLVKAFVDLGSDCVTLRRTTAESNGIKYDAHQVTLKGFGGGECRTLGKLYTEIGIDGLKSWCEVLVVPDDAQPYPLMIGRALLDQPQVKIVKTAGKLHITELEIFAGNTHEGQTGQPYEALEVGDVEAGHLNEAENKELMDLMSEFRGCFSKNRKELGVSKIGEMKIELTSKDAICIQPYRIPFAKREVVERIVDEYVEQGIVRASTSGYSAPVVLTKKKDGSERFCIDYRALNKVTVKQRFPMPVVEEVLASLAGNKYFTKLDLAAGYHQIQVEETSKKFTAFWTAKGCYEFNRMPFGLVNAPAVFQGVMNQILSMLDPGTAVCYLDDVLIASKTVEEGIRKLRRFLEVLQDVGLTLNLKKCSFLKQYIEFLGHEIHPDGMRPGVAKTEAITSFPTPKNEIEVRQFLGLSGYFRKFVAEYAKIARPLTELTRNEVVFIWGPEQEAAFTTIKEKLTCAPVLSLYQPSAEHEVHTDASADGLAGVLLQRDDRNHLRAVCFFSRRTTDAETKYHSYELEVLAIVEALQRFRIYLLGKDFKVMTDCEAIVATSNKTKIIPRIARWWLKLQEFSFQVIHRPGKMAQHVDALSRHPTEQSREVEEASVDVMKVEVEAEDWLVAMQRQDVNLKKIMDVLEGDSCEQKRTMEKEYVLRGNRVFRRIDDGELRWFVPAGIRWRILKTCHDDVGHQGLEKTLDRLRKTYWFPNMRRYTKKYLAACTRCAYAKRKGGQAEGQLHLTNRVPVPFNTINIDHLGPFTKGKGNTAYILSVIDNFTKFCVLRAVKTTNTNSVLKVLTDIFSYFGCPERIITDRGTAYTSKSFEEFCNVNGIKHVKTATRSPRANGQVERLNRTILNGIRCMHEDGKGSDWASQLRALQWGLNSAKNATTKASPHELLLNYQPRDILQNEVLLALQDGDGMTDSDIEQRRLAALSGIEETQRKQKRRYDSKHRVPTKYEEGDIVLVEKEPTATGESRKLEMRYRGPYIVSKVLPHDRYVIEDVPGLQQSLRPYQSIFSSEKIKSYCSGDRGLDDVYDTSDEEEGNPDLEGKIDSGWPNCKAGNTDLKRKNREED